LAKSAFLLWQGHANFIARWTYWNFTTTRTYAKFTMLSGGMDHKTYYDLDRGSEEIYYAAERDALWNLLWYGMQPKVYYNLDLFQKKKITSSRVPYLREWDTQSRRSLGWSSKTSS